ncbi:MULTISPECIES: P63C domain-containing protein [unclassified Mesorhizobium]|uniref:P63C domain-containing protein n=1 Tax=unclassified Mesorhizobium TaxID=325217 RepID=UPI0019D0AE49|nr:MULTISPECIES: P63C domain-containing protein [unclassified Mesorhizobium]
MVDEATRYQRDRAKDALAKLLEAWVAKELQIWVQTFPSEFYEHMFRLRGLDFALDSVKRPQYFGHLTNDIVYKRLEAGVLKDLKRVTPPAMKREGQRRATAKASRRISVTQAERAPRRGGRVHADQQDMGWLHELAERRLPKKGRHADAAH